ncbi:MAG: dolichyl-phosphate beta-glucosyltransferase [Patescibacteria group bacterium]|jgi:dolichyl-phosphate beta-glucosyltransferase
MDEKIYLSIVIPAYREEKRIHVILEAIEKYVKTKDFIVETIVAIDASPDDTVGSAEHFVDRIPNLVIYEGEQNRGKGGAVQDGIKLAKGQYVLFADADNSTPIEQVDKLLAHIDKYDVVIGSRYCKGGKLAIPQSFTRRAGSRALNWMIQALVTPGIKDTQCGFKLFSKEAAGAIFEKLTIFDFSFDIEVLAIAKKLGYKIKEEGITWHDDPHSTVNPLKDGLKMIVDSWKIRQNLQKKIY